MTNLVYLSMFSELIYFGLSFIAAPPLLRAVVAFPSFFVLPGLVLLVALRGKLNSDLSELVVEGFFVSTLISVMLTSLMLMVGLPLTSFNYSSAALILLSLFNATGLLRGTEFKPSKSDLFLLGLILSSFIALLLFFSGFPRLFMTDETSCIFSARMGVLNGEIPPMDVRPSTSEFSALLNCRLFWTYLLASFIASTGLPAYQAGLLGIAFLVMTSLSSSLLVRSRWWSRATSVLVLINPLLFSFSDLALNDSAIAYYSIFSVLFFVRSFTKIGSNVSIDTGRLLCALLSSAILTLVKPNLLIFVAIWSVLVYLTVRYRLYQLSSRHKIILAIVLLLPLVYEFCVDIPYIISANLLRNRRLQNLFGSFLFVSPARSLISSASIFATRSFDYYLDYFYTLLSPSSSSIIIGAVVIALPLLMPQKDPRRDFQTRILALLVFISLYMFYFQSFRYYLVDIARYSLWMLPLWISLTMETLREIEGSSFSAKLLPLLVGALLLLWVNIWVTREKGGVFVGYNLPSRLLTVDVIVIQLMLLITAFGLLTSGEHLPIRSLVKNRVLALKMVNVKRIGFCLLVVIMLANEVYFSLQYFENAQLRQNHGFTTINDALNGYETFRGLFFANNYIHMRAYIDDELFGEGLLLPPPDTEDEFFKLLHAAPNNTRFIISIDDDATQYEYANIYIKSYANSNIITPPKPDVSKLAKLNLLEPFLLMTFDDANETTILDHSGFENNGLNHGAKVVDGYFGKALSFEGKEHISIPIDRVPLVQNGMTISFLMMIEEAKPPRRYTILSKGNLPQNGSFAIYFHRGEMNFELGTIGGLSFTVEPYIGAWHHFIFAYDGRKVEGFVDGQLVGSKPASGSIAVSAHNLEIGRDSETKRNYFIGLIDEPQISYRPLDRVQLSKAYFTRYAILSKKLSLPKGESNLFTLIAKRKTGDQGQIFARNSRIRIDGNLTAILEMEIDSFEARNVSILVGTDRFTKVYAISLNSTRNTVQYRFSHGGLYWPHLAQMRVIVIDQDGSIAYNNFISCQNLELINNSLFALLVGILSVYLTISYRTRRK